MAAEKVQQPGKARWLVPVWHPGAFQNCIHVYNHSHLQPWLLKVWHFTHLLQPSSLHCFQTDATHRFPWLFWVENFAQVFQLSMPAGYEEKKLYFTNAQVERLVGLLMDTGSRDVVLLCHG